MGILWEQARELAKCQPGWADYVAQACEQEYFSALDAFVSEEQQCAEVYPTQEMIFRAFALCPPASMRCLLVGQDPYHEPGQAMGLCFSVPKTTKTPPSLRNIQKEMQDDLGCMPGNDLTGWACNGVLMLNTVLTVRRGQANAHANRGWEQFTTGAAAFALQQQKGPVAAILWGKPAKDRFGAMMQQKEAPRMAVCSAHPSPLSAYRGFFGSKPFSTVNTWLVQQGATPIDWQSAAKA